MTGRNVNSMGDGCEVSLKCVNCPLPECRYDNPIAFQAWKRAQVRQEKGGIGLRMWEEKVPLTVIAKKLKVSTKTASILVHGERDRLAASNLTIH